MEKNNISSPNTEIASQKVTHVFSLLEAIKKEDSFQIFDKNWVYIFSWTLSELWSKINNFDASLIGWFTDKNWKTLFRFWPWDMYWFTNRIFIEPLFSELKKICDLWELKNQEIQSQKIDRLKEISLRIYFKYRDSLADELFLVSHWVYPFQDPDNLKVFEKVSGYIWEHYDAHGIDKSDQLDKLIHILTYWIDKNRTFYTAPFEVPNEKRALLWPALWTSGWTAYKSWIAVLVSGYDKALVEDGIEYVFINDVYWELVPQLKVCFPNYKFYLLSEQKQVLEGITKE